MGDTHGTPGCDTSSITHNALKAEDVQNSVVGSENHFLASGNIDLVNSPNVRLKGGSMSSTVNISIDMDSSGSYVKDSETVML